MAIALCGAHRVGKSTLAQYLAGLWDYEYLPSRAGEIHKEMGLSVTDKLSFEDRMTVQEAILADHIKSISGKTSNIICCRSTIDFASYALCEWGCNAPADGQKRLMAYVDKCIDSAEWLYSAIVLIQPGINYVEEEGKPRPSKTYQETMNRLCSSFIKDDRVKTQRYVIADYITSMAERVDRMCYIYNKMIENLPSPDAFLLH